MDRNSKGLPMALELTKLLVVLIFLWHGVPKAFDPVAATAKFAGWGLPGVLGPVTGWVEVVFAPLLYIRVAHKLALGVLAAIILGAIVTVQLPGGITSGLERDLLILVSLSVLALSGPGRFVLGRRGESSLSP